MSSLIVFLAQYLVILPYGLVGYVWLKADAETRKALFWRAVIIFLVAVLLVTLARQLFPEIRPYIAENRPAIITPAPLTNSFPSGHATQSFAASLLILPVAPYLGVIGLVASVLISIGRVASHVHYPIDILGGLVIALIAFALSYLAYPYKRQSKREA